MTITGDEWGDPGPCPVDDAPHTTCTSPDYTPLSVPLGNRDQTITVPCERPQALTFNTATYRRKPAWPTRR